MNKRSLWEKMVNAVDLATEPIPGKSLVEILGDHSVLIENHCGVISYNSERIMIKSAKGCICVYGRNMILSRMSKEQLRIVGIIQNVELRGRR